VRLEPEPLWPNHPGESATWMMTSHPDHSQDVPMARADDLVDSDSLLAARFVDDALPYLNQLIDRAGGLTCNGVDAEDLVQETMLRAYVGFSTLSEGTNLRAWLFRIMTNTYINYLLRAHHRPSEYLIDRQLAAQDRQSPGWATNVRTRFTGRVADIELADA
jgi:RNA polymerase sigma-70 factor (ECF subfamily)